MGLDVADLDVILGGKEAIDSIITASLQGTTPCLPDYSCDFIPLGCGLGLRFPEPVNLIGDPRSRTIDDDFESIFSSSETGILSSREIISSQDARTDKSQGWKRFHCSYPRCEKTFTRASDLQRHQLSHSSVKQFSCPNCDYQAYRKDHLTQHRLKKHTKEEDESGESKPNPSSKKPRNS